MQYEVIVELKREVLDTEGRAIREVLLRTGAKDLQNVEVSKRFVLEVGDNVPASYVENLAKEFLANTVSETYRVRKL